MILDKEKKQPLSAWNEAVTLRAGIAAFFPLCGAILFRPVDFFKGMMDSGKSKDRLLKAVLFAVILAYAKLFFDLAGLYWVRVFSGSFFPMKEPLALSPSIEVIFSSPLFFLRPLIVFIFTAGFVAIGVKLVLGIGEALLPALFVVCYRSAADLFYAVPLIGGVLAAAWSVALLIVGLREVYRAGFARSVAAGVLMPAAMLFFLLLAAGPSLNRIVFLFYPEMRAQAVKINDITAYTYTASIASAAEFYRKDLGFYPVNLGVLNKYLSDSVVKDATDVACGSGYCYTYARIDDQHYRLDVKPLVTGTTGRLVFYADGSVGVRLDGPDGPALKSLSDIEPRIAQ